MLKHSKKWVQYYCVTQKRVTWDMLYDRKISWFIMTTLPLQLRTLKAGLHPIRWLLHNFTISFPLMSFFLFFLDSSFVSNQKILSFLFLAVTQYLISFLSAKICEASPARIKNFGLHIQSKKYRLALCGTSNTVNVVLFFSQDIPRWAGFGAEC